jgi:hypothetical protein
MPIEQDPQHINDLNEEWPDGGDPIALGDDHIRMIKKSLKDTFPNIEGKVDATHDDLNELVGISSALPDAPASDGSMLYSSGGQWVETVAIKIDGSSVDVNGNISATETIESGGDMIVGGDLVINGKEVSDLTAYTAGEGIAISSDREISLTGEYSGTFKADDVVATSDERAKDSITLAPSDVIAAISGREWVWKDTGNKGSGVIAQELEAAGLDHLVHTNDDGMKAVSYNGLFAYVIEELKALRAAYERDCK